LKTPIQSALTAGSTLHHRPDGDGSSRNGRLARVRAAVSVKNETACKQAADDELPVDPEARRRQAIFSVWAIGFVAAAILFGFRLTTPLALFAILIVGTRRLVLSLLVAAVASGILWVIFDAFLNVRF